MTAKKRKPHAKRGPKDKFLVNDQVLKEIAELSGLGFTNKQIHDYYGISHDTFYQYIKKIPEISESIKKGKAKNLKFVTGKLMDSVRQGNLGAIIFMLKTQYRWSENMPIETGGDEKESLPVLLPTTDPIEAAKIYKGIMTRG